LNLAICALQSQSAISAGEVIGTKHVGQCIAIIGRDPISAKTVLVHADIETSEQSISKLLSNLGTQPFDVFLFGARYTNETDDKWLATESRENLKKAKNVLSQFNCNVVAALVQDSSDKERVSLSSEIFIDPKTGVIYPYFTASASVDEDYKLEIAKRFLNKSNANIDSDCMYDDSRVEPR